MRPNCSRNRQRGDRLPEVFIRAFHARSREIGPYEPHRIDTGRVTPDDVLATLRSRRERGDFVLPPGPMAGECGGAARGRMDASCCLPSSTYLGCATKSAIRARRFPIPTTSSMSPLSRRIDGSPQAASMS